MQAKMPHFYRQHYRRSSFSSTLFIARRTSGRASAARRSRILDSVWLCSRVYPGSFIVWPCTRALCTGRSCSNSSFSHGSHTSSDFMSFGKIAGESGVDSPRVNGNSLRKRSSVIHRFMKEPVPALRLRKRKTAVMQTRRWRRSWVSPHRIGRPHTLHTCLDWQPISDRLSAASADAVRYLGKRSRSIGAIGHDAKCPVLSASGTTARHLRTPIPLPHRPIWLCRIRGGTNGDEWKVYTAARRHNIN